MSKKNIVILDPLGYYPTLYPILEGKDCNLNYFVMKKDEIFAMEKGRKIDRANYPSFYKYTPSDFSSSDNILKNIDQIDVVFIVFSVLNVKIHLFGEHRRKITSDLLDTCYKKIEGKAKKIIIVDIYGWDYDTTNYLKEYKYDYILKRVYAKDVKYAPNVISYPFTCIGGNPDPMYMCIFDRKYGSRKINKVFWAGQLFTHKDTIFNRNNVNRNAALHNVDGPYMTKSKRLPFQQFLKSLGDHKFFLDLHGMCRLNKRFYEVLSRGSLCLGQYQNVVYPFEEGDDWPEEMFYKHPKEFKNTLERLRKDEEQYKKVLRKQHFIVEKYFNKDWIKKYIYRSCGISF